MSTRNLFTAFLATLALSLTAAPTSAREVTVEDVNGRVFVTGDLDDDRVQIEQTNGEIVFRALGDTTVNGQDEVRLGIKGLSRWLDVSTDAGNDAIELLNLVHFTTMTVELGGTSFQGDDDILGLRGVVASDLLVDTSGAGNAVDADTVSAIEDNVFTGTVTILTGRGNDTVNLGALTRDGRDWRFDALDLVIDVGADDHADRDDVTLSNVYVARDLDVELGNTGSNNADRDKLRIEYTDAERFLTVNHGVGVSRIEIVGTETFSLGITTGAAVPGTANDDDVRIVNSIAERMAVATAGEADTVVVHNCIFLTANFAASLGHGDDVFDWRNNFIPKGKLPTSMTVNGGAGSDEAVHDKTFPASGFQNVEDVTSF